MIEELFPKSIDRLKKEQSHKNGPKPLLFSNFDEKTIKQLLLGRNYEKGQGMNPEQVILVRD